MLVAGVASAQSLEADLTPLVEASCLRCRGDRTTTPLNLARLGCDLADHETFAAWEKVYERLELGEMPPASAPNPGLWLPDWPSPPPRHGIGRRAEMPPVIPRSSAAGGPTLRWAGTETAPVPGGIANTLGSCHRQPL